MSLKLTWTNLNVVPTRVRIYRKDTDFDSSSLPAPLVELTNGETSWIDTTAQDGSTYYYVLGSKTDNDEVFTASQRILVADNRGIGSSIIQYGDSSLGFMDEILSADFVNNSTILAAALTTNGLPSALVQPTWYKFIRNNKIIYVPDRVFGVASYMSLYNAGFVFGVDGVGVTPPSATPVNQLRTFDFKGQKYKIRLMRGWGDGSILDLDKWAGTDANHDAMAIAEANEYNDFLYSMCKFVPLKQRTPNWNNLSPDGWLYSPVSSYDASTINSWRLTYRVVCQERKSNGLVCLRGLRECTPNQNAGNPTSKGNLTAIYAGNNTVTNNWVPVLELVEQTVAL